jgi:hypothetical protein
VHLQLEFTLWRSYRPGKVGDIVSWVDFRKRSEVGGILVIEVRGALRLRLEANELGIQIRESIKYAI